MITQQCLHLDSRVLISGVTGLIGGEIVRTLLRSGHKGTIWALIRPSGRRSVGQRLDERLSRSGDAGEVPPNVRPVAGNITEPDWGLSHEDAEDIRTGVDVVIHNAADTSFAVRRNTSTTNIEGVRRLAAFARSCWRTPLIGFMSTASNVGNVTGCCVVESDGCRPGNNHFNDYTHSKAVAEDFLLSSDLPVLNLRPTIVLSAGLPDLEFARQILWCAPLARAFRALPLDPASRLDIVDVGFVAEQTVQLLSHPARTFDSYHISAGPGGASVFGDLLERVGRHYRQKRPLRPIPPSEWTPEHAEKYVRSGFQRRVFRSLRHYFPFLTMDVVFDDARLRHDLGAAYIPPRPVADYFDELLKLIPHKAALLEAAFP
ncbi:MAG TPA: SDR family oxidoreductase [Fimbriiglobus sp.]|jgi:nucleoside-diphosphate-sugar epimerase